MNHCSDYSEMLCSLGQDVLDLVQRYRPNALQTQDNTDSVLLLREIFAILEDNTLDDPECFYRIDLIVRAFQRAGIGTRRHAELE